MRRRKFKSDDPTRREVDKQLQAERLETREADLRWAMEDPRGRRLFHELIYDPVHGLGFDEAPLHTNGSLMFAEAGKRVAARKLVDRLKRDTPDDFLEMHREHLEAIAEARNLRETAAEPKPGRPDPDRED